MPEPAPASGTTPQATRAAIVAPTDPSTTGATCQAIPEGVCESDSDCDHGFECVKAQSSGGCAPAPNGGVPACDTTVTTARYGSCTLKPIACDVDSDCPNGLSCVAVSDGDVTCSSNDPECTGSGSTGSAGSSSGSTGSGSVTPTTKAVEKYCNYQPPSCSDNSDCATDYECWVSTAKECSGGASDPVAVDCSPGVNCVEQPAPADSCQTVSTGYCVPKQMPCNADAQCPTDYVCYQLSAEQVPDIWQTSGDVQTCLPEGIALYAEYAGRDLGSDEDASSGDSDEDPTGAPQLGNAKGPNGHGDGSACSVRSGHEGSSWLLSAVGLLGLALVRRRRQRT
ncbi:MAG: MYXO-CTERM sorting domain-containing protein [Myxococcales bacterium]